MISNFKKATLGALTLASVVGGTTPIIMQDNSTAIAASTEEANTSTRQLLSNSNNVTIRQDFNEKDALESLKHFASKGMLKKSGWFGKKQANAEEALVLLKQYNKVYISNDIGGFDEIVSFKDLQVIDSIRGKKLKPFFAGGISDALDKLEKNNGIYLYKERKIFADSEKRLSSFEAHNHFQGAGKNTPLNVKLGGDDKNPVASIQDIGELGVLQAGIKNDSVLPEETYQALMTFDTPLQRYDNLNLLQGNNPIYLTVGTTHGAPVSKQSKITTFEDLKELNILYGKGKNTILPQKQFDALKYLSDSFANTGFDEGNAYDALQVLQKGGAVTFGFNGGDFDGRLNIKVESLDKLLQAKQMYENQKEYDKYKYDSQEFKDKLATYLNKNFPLFVRDFRSVPANIDNAQKHISSSLSTLRETTNILESAGRNANNFDNTADNSIRSVKGVLNDINRVDFPVRALETFLHTSKDIANQVWSKKSNIESDLNRLSNLIYEKRARENNGGGLYDSEETTSSKSGGFYDSGETTKSKKKGGGFYDDGETTAPKKKKSGGFYDDGGSRGIEPGVVNDLKGRIGYALNEAEEFSTSFSKLLTNIETMHTAVYEANTKMSNAEQKLKEAVTELLNSRNSISDVSRSISSGVNTSKITNAKVQEKANNAGSLLSKAKDMYDSIELKEGVQVNKTASGAVIENLDAAENAILSSNQEKETLKVSIGAIDSSLTNLNNGLQRSLDKMDSALEYANSSREKITWWGKDVSESARSNSRNALGNLGDIEDYLSYIKRNINDGEILREVRRVENEVSMAKNLMGQMASYIDANTSGFNAYERVAYSAVNGIKNAKNQTLKSKGTFENEVSQLISNAKNSIDTSNNGATNSADFMKNARNTTSKSVSLAGSVNRARSSFNSLGKEKSSLTELKGALEEIKKLSRGELEDTVSKELKLIDNQESRPQRPANWTPPEPRVMR